MYMKTKKAILAVSFGTSHNDTRKRTLDVIEKDIQAAFPACSFYRAWTSQIIIQKLKNRDHISIPTVKEAVMQMYADDITDILVVPVYVVHGIENSKMQEEILSFRKLFHSVSFSTPLLSDRRDYPDIIQSVIREFSYLEKQEILVFVGHGTTPNANDIYASLDKLFKENGYKNIFLGTLKTCSAENILKRINEFQPSGIILAPFMITAGKHFQKDIAGKHPKSWYSLFRAAGYEVKTITRGLGEYPGIRQIFIKHLIQTEAAITSDPIDDTTQKQIYR